MPEPSREIKDHTLRLVATLTEGASLKSLGVESPRMVRILDSVVPVLVSAAERTDVLCEAEDGSIWDIEFEMGTGHGRVVPWMRYHLAAMERYPDRPVHTVIVWGKRQTPLPLRAGAITMKANQVCLSRRNGDAVLRGLVARGRPVAAEEVPEIALLPLMGLSPPYGEKVREVVPLLAGLDAGLRDTVLKAMLVFLYERVTPEEWAHLAEVLNTMGLPSKLWEDMYNKGWAEGEAKGEAKGRQADVLEAFEVRFETVPESVRQAVSAEKDGDVLSAWHRGIIRAKDQAEAARIITGG